LNFEIVYNILGISALSACFYRAGGIGKPFRSWMRDWTIPGLVIIVMVFVLKIKAPWWAYLISYPLMGGALTTYLDSIFGYDNFYAHGFLIGLGILPIVIWGSLGWIPFLLRAGVLGLFMGLWCKWFKNDIVEECGRGFFIIATLLIL